jgi:hypothetical protein
MAVLDIIRGTGNFVKDHAPAILTALGAAGFITTTIYTVKATVKAVHNLETLPDDLTKWEIVKESWPYYLPPLLIGGASLTCVIGAQTLNAKKQALLISAYAFSESTLVEYKGKVEEILGEKKAEKVRDSIAEDRVAANPPSNGVIVVSDKESTCYEMMNGRYFKGDIESLRKAQNDINEQILAIDYALLNDFYEKIGLQRTELGDDFGWNHENRLELEFSSVLHDGKPILAIGYRNNPIIKPHRVF